jgi:hypothetical protein
MQFLRSFGSFSLLLLMAAPVQALTVTFTRTNFGFSTGDSDGTNIFAPQDFVDPLLGDVVGWSFQYEGTLTGTLSVFGQDNADPAAPVSASAASFSRMTINGFGFPFSYGEATSLLTASCSGFGSCSDMDSELKPFAFDTGVQASALPLTIDLLVQVTGEFGPNVDFVYTGTNGFLPNTEARGLATLTIEYVPEPGTALLVAFGIGAIATRRRARL